MWTKEKTAKKTPRTVEQVNQEYVQCAIRAGDCQHKINNMTKQIRVEEARMTELDQEHNDLSAANALAAANAQKEAAKLQSVATGKKAENNASTN